MERFFSVAEGKKKTRGRRKTGYARTLAWFFVYKGRKRKKRNVTMGIKLLVVS